MLTLGLRGLKLEMALMARSPVFVWFSAFRALYVCFIAHKQQPSKAKSSQKLIPGGGIEAARSVSHKGLPNGGASSSPNSERLSRTGALYNAEAHGIISPGCSFRSVRRLRFRDLQP